MMRTFKILLYNLNIVIAGVVIVFQILDLYNPTMDFLGSSFSIYMMFTFCVLSIINASSLLVRSHKATKAKMSKSRDFTDYNTNSLKKQ